MRLVLLPSAVVALSASIPWGLPALAADGTWFQYTPISRAYHGAVYDPVRQRMIVLGGQSIEPLNDVRSLALSGPLAWTRLDAPSSVLPTMGDVAAFDGDSDRIIVYGGIPSVIALRTGTPTTWYAPTVTGTPITSPGPSWTFDSVGKRLLFFGGYNGTTYLNDVWALSFGPTLTWQHLAPTGTLPPGRRGAALAFDAARNRLVIFGGYGNKADPFAPPGELSDVWTLSFSPTLQWSELTPSGTVPQAGTAKAVFDGARDRMLVFRDGSGATSVLGFNPSPAWTGLSIVPGPTGDYNVAHTVVLDPVGDRVVVFGGNPLPSVANTWILSLGSGTWTTSLFGAPQPVSASPTLVFDPPRDRLLMLRYNAGLLETWAFDFATAEWTSLTTVGPPPLGSGGSGAFAWYDPYADRLVVYGSTTSTTQLWTLSLSSSTPTWTQITLNGAAHPPPNPSFTYDPVRNRLVCYQLSLGTWVLDLASPAWVNVATTGTPPGPVSGSNFAGTYDPVHDDYVVSGGDRFLSGGMNGSWTLDLGTLAWSVLVPPGSAETEVGQTALFDPGAQRIAAFGGAFSPSGNSNRTLALNLVGPPVWAALNPLGALPNSRRSHAIVLDPIRDQLLLFGGTGNFGASTFAGPWALVWGAAGPPSVACAGGGGAALAGTTVSFDYPLANAYGFPQTVVWELRSQRAWPGYPKTGTTTVPAIGSTTVHIDVAVPDSAATAPNALTFRAVFQKSAFPVTCTRNLYVVLDAPGPLTFSLALGRAGAEPGRQLSFEVALPDARPSRLEVFDVGGRRVFQRQLEALGAGRHVVRADVASIRPGVYMARLSGAAGVRSVRAVVIY